MMTKENATMKNRSLTILTILLIVLTFNFSILAQNLQDDPQQGTFPDGAKAHQGKVRTWDIKFSPDGTHLAIASDIGVLLYDTQTYDKPDLLKGQRLSTWSVAFSPKGKKLVSTVQDGTIRLWNIHTGQQIRTIAIGYMNPMAQVAFSPDGTKIASAQEVENIGLWDTNTGKLLHTLSGHANSVHGVVFSPDGNMLASASSDKTVRL